MGIQRYGVGRRRWLVPCAALALGLVFYARSAAADAIKCERAIVKASAAFVSARFKTLGKCEDKKRQRKLDPATVCTAESDVVTALQKAGTKLQGALDKACGGDDKVCGGGDDEPLAGIAWPATCPNLEGGSCTNTIADCLGIGTCLECVNQSAVDRAVALYYASLQPPAPGPLGACQAAIGKNTAKFYLDETKALVKCWDARLMGKHDDVCPDAGAAPNSPAEKAATAIAKAEAKKVAAICKACGGSDKKCDGNADRTPAEIGFPASCPAVAGCGGAVDALADLVACVDCVSEFRVDCSIALGVPGFVPYPAGCAGPLPTPTRTTTPTATSTTFVTVTPTRSATPTATATGTLTRTPTPTRTATPTVTRTPTPTRTKTPTPSATRTPSCGNGVTEPAEECDDHNGVSGDGCDSNCTVTRCGNGVTTTGEDCDDGNTFNCDSCPKDCKTSTAPVACTSVAGTHSQHIHLSAPPGAVLSGGVFCIDYPAGVVALPGTGLQSGTRVSGMSGTLLNDFNNAVQLSFAVNPGQQTWDPSIGFDLCTGQTAPLPTAFVCVTKSASSMGQTLDPATVECTPMTP